MLLNGSLSLGDCGRLLDDIVVRLCLSAGSPVLCEVVAMDLPLMMALVMMADSK